MTNTREMQQRRVVDGGARCEKCSGPTHRFVWNPGVILKKGDYSYRDYCYSCNHTRYFYDGVDYETGAVPADGKYVRFLDRSPCSKEFAYAESEAWKASVGGMGVPRAVVTGASPCPRCRSRNQYTYRHGAHFKPGLNGHLRTWIHCRVCHGAIGLEQDWVASPAQSQADFQETIGL